MLKPQHCQAGIVNWALPVGVAPAARNMHVPPEQRKLSTFQPHGVHIALDAKQRAPVINRSVATRGLRVHAAPAGAPPHCTYDSADGDPTKLEIALKDASCSEIEVQLHAPVALLDTLAVSSTASRKVTIRGVNLASGQPPTLQVGIFMVRVHLIW